MARFIDPRWTNNLLDANILDDVANGRDPDVNEIVRLVDDEGLQVVLPYSVKAELESKSTPSHVRAAASHFLFTLQTSLTSQERQRRDRLFEAAKRNADLKNIAADLGHVFEAAKYGGYFITKDSRLLSRRDTIVEVLQINVVNPREFLAAIEQAKSRPF